MLSRGVEDGGILWVAGRILGMVSGVLIAATSVMPWIRQTDAFGTTSSDYGFERPTGWFFVVIGLVIGLSSLGRPRFLATGRQLLLPVLALAVVLAVFAARIEVLGQVDDIERLSLSNRTAEVGEALAFLAVGAMGAIAAAVLVLFRTSSDTADRGDPGVPEQASSTIGREIWRRQELLNRRNSGPQQFLDDFTEADAPPSERGGPRP